MSSIFKQFSTGDITSTRTLLNEAIPITGSLTSGTYIEPPSTDSNVKMYSHGMFTSIYDYPYLSSSANHLFDKTFGYTAASSLYNAAEATSAKKLAIYNEMAQVLVGHDVTGSILKFDQDGNLLAGGTKYNEAYFLCFSRLLYKDEIKKGSFSITLGMSGALDPCLGSENLTITDVGAQNDYRVNSPAGEYGILSCSAGGGYVGSTGECGLIFYQAGIVVLSSLVFSNSYATGSGFSGAWASASTDIAAGSMDFVMSTGSITGAVDAFRQRICNISFNNTTELNSTIYFCRLNHNEFNYSSNPTYLSGSKIRVKDASADAPISYLTSVGLYDSQGRMLSVAKLSEPLRKTIDSEITIRVRQDF